MTIIDSQVHSYEKDSPSNRWVGYLPGPEEATGDQMVVAMDEVENKWCNIITNARNKLLGIPAKAKQRIPDLDTNAVACLDDIVREALEELSAA